MNEMLYGNSGKSDEGINIDMEQGLYQKLQRMFVPKLKAILSVHHQEGDRNFVYLGEVAEKAGNFTIYGYNAKLASDLRGGDYGHYVAVAHNGKAATVNFDSIGFLSEEGFVEYVNNKTVNEEARFTVKPVATDINVEVKKKIVNNIMESFMKVRRRKCVAFAMEDCPLDEFNAKSLGVLLEIIKYIPYRMRKNISFVSHVATNQRLPDAINLAAYPSEVDVMPRDCIVIENPGEMFIEGAFKGYIEKVFAMSDSEREEYFEKLYTEIETPALEAGVEVKSDMYLIDIDTKELWKNGSGLEAVKNIFASLDSVLKIYPEYAKIAGIRLVADKEETIAYIKNTVTSAISYEEIKTVFDNISGVYGICSIDMGNEVIEIFKEKASTFILGAGDYAALAEIAGAIVSIDTRLLDELKLVSAIKGHMGKNLTFEGIFDVYCAFKEKDYIGKAILDECLAKATEDYILNLTGSIPESKDKLSALERAYESFRLSYEGRDFATLKEVYDSYHGKFSGNTSVEAISKGNAVVNEIEKGIYDHCPIYQLKEYVKKLSEVEVEYDPILKARVSVVYKRLTQALYRQLVNTELSLKEINALSTEFLRAAKQLHANGVYDGELRTTIEGKTYVPDGLLRFATTICELITCVKEVEDLAELLMSHDMIRGNLTHEDNTIKKLYSDYAPAIMNYWLNKNRKIVTANKLKKAIKLVKKETGNEPSRTAKGIVEEYLKYGKKKKKGSGLKIVIVAVVILALLVGVFFGYKALFGNKNKDPYANAKYSISVEEKTLVDEYLEKFSGENLTDAEFVIGAIKGKTNGKEKEYILNITDNLESSVFDGKFAVQNTYIEGASKKYIDLEKVKNGKEYAFVVQKGKKDNKFYVRDVFEIPTKLDKHDFEVPVKDKKTNEKDEFLTSVIKYIGFQAKLVKPEEKKEPKDVKNEANKGQTEEKKETKSEKPEGNKKSQPKTKSGKGNEK